MTGLVARAIHDTLTIEWCDSGPTAAELHVRSLPRNVLEYLVMMHIGASAADRASDA